MYKRWGILPLFVFIGLIAQGQSMASVERGLMAKYLRIGYWRSREGDSTVSASDSIGKANLIFKKALIRACSSNGASLNYPFKLLADTGLMITTSADHRLRIYSWDTQEGGSMHFFLRVYQWAEGQRVHARAAVEGEDDPGVFCKPIYTLNTPSATYYLVINHGIASTKDASQGIQAVRIDGPVLNDTVSIFHTPSGHVNGIQFFFDFFSVVDRPERPVQLIQYDAVQKLISIPVVPDDGKVTDRRITYQWSGRYFERKK